MPSSLEPRNLEIRGRWDGKLENAVDISVIVEVESVPDTQLQLLDTTSPGVLLRQSFLWRLEDAEEGYDHANSEPFDDSGTRYFSVDEDTTVRRTPSDSCRISRLFYTRGSDNIPFRKRLFAPSPSSSKEEDEYLRYLDLSSGQCSTLTLGSLEHDTDQVLPDISDDIAESSTAGSQSPGLDNPSGQSRSPDFLTSPKALSDASFKLIKHDETDDDHLLRKRTAKEAGFSDSGSNAADEQHVEQHVEQHSDVQESTAHKVAPSPAPHPAQGSELTPQKTRSAQKHQHVKIPHGSPIRTDGPSFIPKRAAHSDHLIPESPKRHSKLVSTFADSIFQHEGHLRAEQSTQDQDLSQGSFHSKQHVYSFDGANDFSPELPVQGMAVPLPDVQDEDIHESSGENDRSKDAANTDYQDSYVATLSLPPSPTPSSQDLMPWNPTTDPLDCSDNADDIEKGVYTWGCSGYDGEEPEIKLVKGQLLLQIPSTVGPGVYRIKFVASVMLNPETDGWLSLLLSGLPKSSSGALGALYFGVTTDQGIEFKTAGLHAPKMDYNFFQARFDMIGHFCVSFRLLTSDLQILSSFDVDQEIRADSVVIRSKDESCQGHPHIAYHALCSIRLPEVLSSTDKCTFAVHVDGGPEGQFVCELDAEPGFQVIQIDGGGERSAGVSHVEVTCVRHSLEAFAITWCVRRRASTWLPRIYPASSTTYTREGNHFRRIFDHVKSVLIEGDEDEYVVETFVDEEDVQSAVSSEFVMYPEMTWSEQSLCVLAYLVIERSLERTRQFVRGLLSVRRHTLFQILISLLLFTHLYLPSIIRVQWMSNHRGYSPGNPGNKVAATILGLHCNRPTGSPNFSILATGHIESCLTKAESCSQSPTASDIAMDDTDMELHRASLDSATANRSEPETVEVPPPADVDPLSSTGETSLAEHTGSEFDSNLVLKEKCLPEGLSFRDRLDYFLGWKGPSDG